MSTVMTMPDDSPRDPHEAPPAAQDDAPPIHDSRSGNLFTDNGEPPAEGDVIKAGAPLAEGTAPVATEEPVVEALRTVFDPEIPVNIYDLGLIYDLKIAERGDVDITMTLTAPGCPVAGSLPREVADVVAAVEGVGQVSVSITWDPPWTPANMSEAARVALDMF